MQKLAYAWVRMTQGWKDEEDKKTITQRRFYCMWVLWMHTTRDHVKGSDNSWVETRSTYTQTSDHMTHEQLLHVCVPQKCVPNIDG